MKGYLLLFGILVSMLTFFSCSKDKDDEPEQLEFIQVQVTSEDIPTPNGNVYLFKVNGYDIESDEPNSWVIDYTPILSYKYNGETKSMTPISSYGSEREGDLLLNSDKGCSLYSIYWDDLALLYGTPKAGDEYLIFIELKNGTHVKASKRFIIERNSVITVKFPPCADQSDFVNAEWFISDYK